MSSSQSYSFNAVKFVTRANVRYLGYTHHASLH